MKKLVYTCIFSINDFRLIELVTDIGGFGKIGLACRLSMRQYQSSKTHIRLCIVYARIRTYMHACIQKPRFMYWKIININALKKSIRMKERSRFLFYIFLVHKFYYYDWLMHMYTWYKLQQWKCAVLRRSFLSLKTFSWYFLFCFFIYILCACMHTYMYA